MFQFQPLETGIVSRHEVPTGRRWASLARPELPAFRRNQNHLRRSQGLRWIARDLGPGAEATGLYAFVALRPAVCRLVSLCGCDAATTMVNLTRRHVSINVLVFP